MELLRAGCAKVDITPPVGTTMDGFAARILPSEGIHDRLFGRVIVIEDGRTSVALVSCDVCWFTEAMVQEVKRQATAIGVDFMILAATHNHSGPAMTDFVVSLTLSGAEYIHKLPGLIADTIQSAHRKLQPVSLTVGRSKAWVSINRRKTSVEIDPEVIMLILKNEAGRPIAGVLNYGCHPTVLGQENRQISADYPGCCAELIERSFGEEFVCLFFNGACGDVNPKTCIGYDCRGTFADVLEIARKLASVSAKHSHFTEIQSDEGIRFENSTIGPFPPYDLRFEINALGVGDLVIFGIPGEVFASTGLWLKEHTGITNLLLASYTNGYIGYLPAKDAFVRKDAETEWVCWVDNTAEEVLRTEAATLAGKISGREVLPRK